ncbi:MAG TPA: type II toxin-antitoxin system VapC family toxin [Caulobacter sp.]|nr:type II toxin-antitoxin system VapC family toxin [Caulobacter sp.]
MVVDTSAIYAIIAGEPERERFSDALDAAAHKWISTATLVECVAVLLGKGFEGEPTAILDAVVETYNMTVVPVDDVQWRLSAEGLMRFGKGRHRAKLNIGDSFAYALARQLDQPLLFKGDDFNLTDVKRVFA